VRFQPKWEGKEKYFIRYQLKDKQTGGAKLININFSEDLITEYQILKMFLAIFQIYYKSNGEWKAIKGLLKKGAFTMDDMDSFLQFFISRRIINQRNRFRPRDINKVFS